MGKYAENVVKLINSWVGKNEKDGSYKEIIDIYNSYQGPFPRGLKMKYEWAWCACTCSAVAIKLGYTDIMPIEISCAQLIKKAQQMGIWIENDDTIPMLGDYVLYDWDDKTGSKSDNKGNPDHVGFVTYVNPSSGYFEATEGNYKDSVKKRTVSINGKYIRGFIRPKYDNRPEEPSVSPDQITKTVEEAAIAAIAGKLGNGNTRKKAVESMGLAYSDVQKRINEILNTPKKTQPDDKNRIEATAMATSRDVKFAGRYRTTANLYCRNDAGTNKKALCKIPKNSIVKSSSGEYTMVNGVMWLLVEYTAGNLTYQGFSSSQYLKKAE